MRPESRGTTYDVLVVGGGTAGCVLGRRLSELGTSVLVVEAGPDTPPGQVPKDISDLYPRSYYNPAYAWKGLRADLGTTGRATSSHYTQARVLGGGSSLMGMVALRGLPDDYDGWGIPGWYWQDVLPQFRHLEDDRDFTGSLHGVGGPITIRRHLSRDWPPFSVAVGEALSRGGWPMVADFNGEFGEGHGPVPMSSTLSGRVSAASAYLDAETRARPNLQLLCNTTVARLDFVGSRCIGATAMTEEGDRLHLRAGRTIVCAGAIWSPALLMRSGVGPADHLKSLGIEVVVDAPGVGSNLQNHPVVYLAAYLKHGARQPESLRPAFNTGLRFRSDRPGAESGELQMLVLNKSSWHGLGSAVAGLGIALMRPLARGSVRLRSADPQDRPEVSFGLLSEPSDVQRVLSGFRLACEVMRDASVVGLRHETFAAGYSGVVRRLNRPGRVTATITGALSRILDGPAPLRRELLRWGIASGDTGESRLASAAWQEGTVFARTFATYHPVGTCRMGPDGDELAVTNNDGTVHGAECLSVIDASIMPRIPRANTSLPVLMVAERCAEMLMRRHAI